MTTLSQLQRGSLHRVIQATLRGVWYRAGQAGTATAQGESVTLSSLWRATLLERRIYRGRGPNASYEYQAAPETIKAWKEIPP